MNWLLPWASGNWVGRGMEADVARVTLKLDRFIEVDTLKSMSPVNSSEPYCRSKYELTRVPLGVNAVHCHHWSVVACPLAVLTTGSWRGSAVLPVNEAPALLETLSMILLLHAPGVLTPV